MTMRGLASATGRGLATFYDYFSSKEDLLFSLQTDAFETMSESVTAALEDVEEPVDRLYVFVLNHLRYAAEHKSVMRVLVHEASALPAGRRKTVRLLKEGYFNICRDIVAAILAAGCNSPGASGVDRLDSAEVERITYSVFGMLNWSYGWYDPQQHGTPQDVARTIHALAVCGLVARCPQRVAQGNLERHLGAIASPLLGRSARGVAALAKRLSGETLDLLFVNAGVKGPANQEPGHATLAEVGQLFFTNAVAPINLAQRFVGQIRKDSGVLAFMSSVLGSVTIPATGKPVIAFRATDGKGATQTDARTPPAPDGATAAARGRQDRRQGRPAYRPRRAPRRR